MNDQPTDFDRTIILSLGDGGGLLDNRMKAKGEDEDYTELSVLIMFWFLFIFESHNQ